MDRAFRAVLERKGEQPGSLGRCSRITAGNVVQSVETLVIADTIEFTDFLRVRRRCRNLRSLRESFRDQGGNLRRLHKVSDSEKRPRFPHSRRFATCPESPAIASALSNTVIACW